MLEQAQDDEQIIARVAALDIGKAEVMCCIRVPGDASARRRRQEVQAYSTMTRSLLVMADRLRELRVTRVVMEATSDYWKPVFYLLEAHGFDPWLVNAKDVKHLPGRPKTDKLDAVWLCKIAERQMTRPSFIPPPPIRQLRDLTRYRGRSGLGPHRREEPSREAARGRPDQTLRRRHEHLRSVRPRHDGRPDRRGTRPESASADGPGAAAREDEPTGGGVPRALHRPSRVPVGQDARPG